MPQEGDGTLITWSFPVKSQTLIHFGELDSAAWQCGFQPFQKGESAVQCLIKQAAVPRAVLGICGQDCARAQVSPW